MAINAKLKETLLRKMSEDNSVSLRQLAKENNIGYATLCRWRTALNNSAPSRQATEVPVTNAENWPSKDKFLAVLAHKGMSNYEKSEYCRSKGLFIEQVEAWEKACIQANGAVRQASTELTEKLKDESLKVKKLEQELRRKEKALAETAALLVLRKKAEAIWGENEAD